MNCWDVAASTLADAGVTHVFGLPADEPGLLDAADTHPALTGVPVRDQRVGACAATGFAAASGVPAVLALTTGPAFTNALTGLLEAASLGLPLVVVTTRVSTAELGRGAFQEVDQEKMATPLLKGYIRVELVDRLAWALHRAVHLAINGRPGIIMVEITDEVQRAELPGYQAGGPVRRLRTTPPVADLAHAARLLASAKRPLLVVGGGARAAGAGEALTTLAELLGAPVFTTASGRGSIDEDHDLAGGVVGLYLTPPLDKVVDAADVLCVVGSRLEETARIGWSALARQRVVQVDVDSAAFGQAVTVDVALLGDAALTAAALADEVARLPQPDRVVWRQQFGKLRASALAQPRITRVLRTFGAVEDTFGANVTFVQENGLHDIWGYHFSALRVRRGTVVVGPGEQTMMGFGLPAAIGAALARPEQLTVLVCGDGALGISVTALPTIAEIGIGLAVVVFDNGGFGWPRHGRQALAADDTLTRFDRPSPVAEMVRALGGTAVRVNGDDDLPAALAAARDTAAHGGLALVIVPVDDGDIPAGVRRVEELS